MTEMSWGFFSRRQKVIFLYLMTFDDILILKIAIFQMSTFRKILSVPTPSRPTPAEVPHGTIWYLMVPYGTLWYHMVQYGTIRYLMVP